MTVSRWSCDVCDVCFSGLTVVIINHNTLCDKIYLDYMCNGFCLSDLQRFFQGRLNSVLRISVQSWHTPRKECVVLLHTLFYCVIIKHAHAFPSVHCCKAALHKTCEKLFSSSLVLSTGHVVCSHSFAYILKSCFTDVQALLSLYVSQRKNQTL